MSANLRSTALSAVLALVCSLSGEARSSTEAPTPSGFVPEGYRLVWHDEFDGDSLDKTKWNFRIDQKWGSEQKEGNVSVSDGNLVLHLTHEPENNLPEHPYSGAGVISKKTFVYGYYEARFKNPGAQGWHTSFWLMGYKPDVDDKKVRTSAHEIDICENESFNPRSFGANFHKWTEPKKHFGSKGPKNSYMYDTSKEFGVWGCEVTPTAIHCFFNGNLVATYDPTELGALEPHNILLTSICSLKVSRSGGKMNPSEHPATAEFDYVRYYQKP